eukprot:GSChrysophyteH2.ASY1.ANO1.1655.1 assembled CDS
MPGLHACSHPVLSSKMTQLRDKSTKPVEFRRLLKEITYVVGIEATRTMKTHETDVTTPMGVEHHGKELSEQHCIIPILRAGLAMGDGMMELLPDAAVHHIGMYRAKGSLLPIQYYNRLPRDTPCDVAYISDPCIATSNTLQACVSIVKRWGAKRIVVVAAVGAKSGVKALLKAHPDIDIYIGEVDNTLSDEGMILPGIGDAGDRLFGTPTDEVEEHSPKKRKH